MHCVFCKGDSCGSSSVEHIIPESLGNRSHFLPAGVVCDRCNNYFAVKIEGPLLMSDYFRQVRFHNDIASKRGRIPAVQAIALETGVCGVIYKSPPAMPILSVDEAAVDRFLSGFGRNGRVNMLFPVAPQPPAPLLARFIAKVGLEILTARVMSHPGWEAAVVFRRELDEVRAYARYGTGPATWPISVRRIYEDDAAFKADDGTPYQMLHEFMPLYTNRGELYAVIAIFGMEYAINLCGPELQGYEDWLQRHGRQSPLYARP